MAVVSGGSKGLGLAICRTLLGAGYAVATCSRTLTAPLQQTIDDSKGKLLWDCVDITQEPQLLAFLQRVRQTLGRVGYLVNSAGIAVDGPLTTTKSKDIASMLEVNLAAAIHLSRGCAKQMMVERCGVILNVSSVVGLRGHPGLGAYSATKAALDGLTRSLARELGPAGIRVNSVAPGFLATQMTAALSEQQKSRIIDQTPLGRLGTVEDVSAVVKFLLSDEARFITGQTFVVDGGLTA